jgi:hypothetical protein
MSALVGAMAEMISIGIAQVILMRTLEVNLSTFRIKQSYKSSWEMMHMQSWPSIVIAEFKELEMRRLGRCRSLLFSTLQQSQPVSSHRSGLIYLHGQSREGSISLL